MKKNFIRLLALLLMLSMVVCAFASCFGQSDKDDSEKQIDEGNPPVDDGQGGNQGNGPAPDEPHHTIVVFDDGLGNETIVDVRNDSESVTVSEPEAPTREGFNFLGWYEDGASDPYDFSSSVYLRDSFVLRAKWEMIYVPFEEISLKDFLPQNVSFELRVPSLQAVIYSDEQDAAVGSADAIDSFMIELTDVRLFLGLDEEKELNGICEGKVMVTDGDSFDASYVASAYVEDGMFIAIVDDSENIVVRCRLEELFADAVETGMNSAGNGTAGAVIGLLQNTFEAGIPLNVYNELKKFSEFDGVEIGALAPLFELFFTKESTEGNDTYRLDYDKLDAINENLDQMTVKELIDSYFGALTFDTVKLAAQYILHKPIGEVISLYRIPTDTIVAYAAPVLEQLGLSQVIDLSALLSDPETLDSTLLELIVGDNAEMTAQITEYVEGIFAYCEILSVYDVVEQIAIPMITENEDSEDGEEDPAVTPAQEEEEPVDLYAIVDEIISALRESVWYAFNAKDGKFAAEMLLVNNLEIPGLPFACSLMMYFDADHPSYDPDWKENLAGIPDGVEQIVESLQDRSEREEELGSWMEESGITFHKDEDGKVTSIEIMSASDFQESDESFVIYCFEDGEWVEKELPAGTRRDMTYSGTRITLGEDYSFIFRSAKYGHSAITFFAPVKNTYYHFVSYVFDDEPDVTYFEENGQLVPVDPQPEISYANSFTLYLEEETGFVRTEEEYMNYVWEQQAKDCRHENLMPSGEIDMSERTGHGNLLIKAYVCMDCYESFFEIEGQTGGDMETTIAETGVNEENGKNYTIFRLACKDCGLETFIYAEREGDNDAEYIWFEYYFDGELIIHIDEDAIIR